MFVDIGKMANFFNVFTISKKIVNSIVYKFFGKVLLGLIFGNILF